VLVLVAAVVVVASCARRLSRKPASELPLIVETRVREVARTPCESFARKWPDSATRGAVTQARGCKRRHACLNAVDVCGTAAVPPTRRVQSRRWRRGPGPTGLCCAWRNPLRLSAVQTR
jgi:hypothetical protein